MVTVSKINEFNTGAHYTKEGQVIRWRVTDRGTTEFFDWSRQICGEIVKVCKSNDEVHQAYLHDNYRLGASNLWKELAREPLQDGTGKIHHNGKMYTYVSKMIETDFGPERLVEFRDRWDRFVDTVQETMSLQQIIEEFKESRGNK